MSGFPTIKAFLDGKPAGDFQARRCAALRGSIRRALRTTNRTARCDEAHRWKFSGLCYAIFPCAGPAYCERHRRVGSGPGEEGGQQAAGQEERQRCGCGHALKASCIIPSQPPELFSNCATSRNASLICCARLLPPSYLTLTQHLLTPAPATPGGGGGGGGGGDADGKDVVTLDAASFKKQVLESEDLWFVEFFAPWCVF